MAQLNILYFSRKLRCKQAQALTELAPFISEGKKLIKFERVRCNKSILINKCDGMSAHERFKPIALKHETLQWFFIAITVACIVCGFQHNAVHGVDEAIKQTNQYDPRNLHQKHQLVRSVIRDEKCAPFFSAILC